MASSPSAPSSPSRAVSRPRGPGNHLFCAVYGTRPASTTRCSKTKTSSAYVFTRYFEAALWESWAIVYTTHSETLPAEYVNIRRCIRDIAPLLADGATISATAHGRGMGQRDTVSLSGEITDILHAVGVEDVGYFAGVDEASLSRSPRPLTGGDGQREIRLPLRRNNRHPLCQRRHSEGDQTPSLSTSSPGKRPSSSEPTTASSVSVAGVRCSRIWRPTGSSSKR